MNYYDYRDYFRQIIDLLESLISKFDAWTAAVTGFWNTLLSFLPTEAFTEILKCVTATATTIVGNPFLLFTVIFLFAGGVIGIMGRILSRN